MQTYVFEKFTPDEPVYACRLTHGLLGMTALLLILVTFYVKDTVHVVLLQLIIFPNRVANIMRSAMKFGVAN